MDQWHVRGNVLSPLQPQCGERHHPKFPTSQRETQKGRRRASLHEPAGTYDDRGPGPWTRRRTTVLSGAGGQRREHGRNREPWWSRVSWERLKPNSCHLLISEESQFVLHWAPATCPFQGVGTPAPCSAPLPPGLAAPPLLWTRKDCHRPLRRC